MGKWNFSVLCRGSDGGMSIRKTTQHGRPILVVDRYFQPRMLKRARMGVGGAHSTGEVLETERREGALVQRMLHKEARIRRLA